jgi:outer membrane protein TolC
VTTAALLALALLQAPSSNSSQVLTLEQALRQAEERNFDLKAAAARLMQAEEIASKVWAGYFPQIGVGGNYTRNSVAASISLPTNYFIRDVGQPQGPPFDPTQPASVDNPPGRQTSYIMFPDSSSILSLTIQKLNQFGAQAQITQALIVPALWPAIRNAYLAQEIAGLGLEGARREILFAVAQLYYGAAGAKQALVVQKRQLALNLEHEQDAKVRYDAGATPKVAYLRAQIDRSRAEQDVRRAQNGYTATLLMLGTMLDRPADFDVALPTEPSLPADPATLEDAAIRDRPDLKAARAAVTLAERSHDAVFLKYAPSVVAFAQYRIANVKGFTGTYDAWAAGANLSWTIWDGGTRESELRETRAKLAEVEAQWHSAEARTRDEVRRALLDLESARANKVKASEQVKLARENIELVKTSYTAGAATYLEVSDSSTALLSSEIGLVAETLNANLAALKLLKAAGAFASR